MYVGMVVVDYVGMWTSYMYRGCAIPTRTISGDEARWARRVVIFGARAWQGSPSRARTAEDDCTRMRLILIVALHSNAAAMQGSP